MADKVEWKMKMRKHLGTILQKHYDSLMLDIILICIGLKPSLLFDYSCIDPVKAVHLLDDLHKSGLMPVALDVVVLGQDFYITDIDSLVKTLKENIKYKRFALIDVSGNLERPREVVRQTELEILNHFKDLLTQLDVQSDFGRISKRYSYIVEVKEEWNLSTIFGFLLCYPVIYWFDQKLRVHNCLSLIPLHLYRACVKLPLQLKANLSKAFEGFASNMQKATKPRNVSILYSFSTPQHLNLVVETYVQHWRECVKEKSLNLFSSDQQVVVDKSLVVEKEVIL